MNGNIRVRSVYRKGNKPVCYGVFYHNQREYGVLSYKEAYEACKTGNISNMYIRNNALVLKRKYGIAEYEYKGVVAVKYNNNYYSQCRVPGLFSVFVTPEMLDKTCMKLIRDIDNAVPERDFLKYGKFSTPQGVCDMSELSSGCRSAVYAYLSSKSRAELFDATSMGANAMVCLMDVLIKNNNNRIVLHLRGIPKGYKNEYDGYLFKYVDNNKIYGYLDFLANHME